MLAHEAHCTETLTLYPPADGQVDSPTLVACPGCDLTGLYEVTPEALPRLARRERATIEDLPPDWGRQPKTEV